MATYQPNGGGKQSLVTFMRTALAKCTADGRVPRRWEMSMHGLAQLRHEAGLNLTLAPTGDLAPAERFMGVPIAVIRKDGIKCALIVDEERR